MGYIGRMLLRVFKVFGLVEVCTLSFTQLMPVLLRMRRMLRTSLPKPKLVTSDGLCTLDFISGSNVKFP
ncbi:hypothetical protein KC19_10G010100 [Ceratodon purpureus]|uniref:Uncharacterized protein n=1 Tax=Ceratodon purpureus TaxID=3225 RepID=A0A8T0GJ28_CERPU|nr:hypothetical protein KC19_10G010100 [Ceratodon purpureus]